MNPLINIASNLLISVLIGMSAGFFTATITGLGSASGRHTHPITVPMDEIQEA